MIALNRLVNTLDPLLLPVRDEHYRLHDVFEKVVDGCRDEIVLDFGDSCLRFSVDADTDSIMGRFQGTKFSAKRGYQSIISSALWRPYLEEECGWTWLAINQQGYWDTILIAFTALESPSAAAIAATPSIRVAQWPALRTLEALPPRSRITSATTRSA